MTVKKGDPSPNAGVEDVKGALLRRLANREKAKAERAYRTAAKYGAKNPRAFSSEGKGYNFRIRKEWSDALKAAAEAQGLSSATYLRRVMSVKIAEDLGVPVREILSYCPAPMPPMGVRKGLMVHGTDDGEGIESFCLHPGCDGSHIK